MCWQTIQMYALANNPVFLVPLLYFAQYCRYSSSSQRSNMKSWEVCFIDTFYTSSVDDTYRTIPVYQTSFSVDHHHDSLYIVIFLLNLSTFFIANPLFRDRGKFVYSADNCLILCTDPLRLSFFLEATDRDLTKTLIWQTDYLAI